MNEPPKAEPRLRAIDISGLFRCCIATIQALPGDAPEHEGARIRCTHCGDGIWFHDGAWRWEP